MFCLPLSNSALMDNKLLFLTWSHWEMVSLSSPPPWSFSMEFLPSPPEEQDHSWIRSSHHEPLGGILIPQSTRDIPKSSTSFPQPGFHEGQTRAGGPGWVGAAPAFCSQFVPGPGPAFLALPVPLGCASSGTHPCLSAPGNL